MQHHFSCRLESWGPESPLNWQINVCLSLRPALTTRPAMMPNILGYAYFGARMIPKQAKTWHTNWCHLIRLAKWPFSCDIILYCLLRFVFVFVFVFDTSFDDKNLIIVPEESPPIRNELWIHPMLHLGNNFAGGSSLKRLLTIMFCIWANIAEDNVSTCQEIWQKLLKNNENDLNWWLTSWGLTRLSSSGSWTRLLERYKRTQTYNKIRMMWCPR